MTYDVEKNEEEWKAELSPEEYQVLRKQGTERPFSSSYETDPTVGVYKCRACDKPFSVTVGTVFERSHIPLTKWLLATQLLTSSKKGISAHQLHRMLGVTYKTAWFMAHRIREAMKPAEGADPIGGEGKTVEADEMYIGNKVGKRKAPGAGG